MHLLLCESQAFTSMCLLPLGWKWKKTDDYLYKKKKALQYNEIASWGREKGGGGKKRRERG